VTLLRRERPVMLLHPEAAERRAAPALFPQLVAGAAAVDFEQLHGT